MISKGFINSSIKSGILYNGDNLSIQLSNNTDKSYIESRSKQLTIVDYGDCEDKLKKDVKRIPIRF